MSSTVAPRKLCTLTTRPFLLNRSCIIPFKMESPIMIAVPSGYFFSFLVCCLLLLAHYFCCQSFEFIGFFFLLSNHFFKLSLHRFLNKLLFMSYIFLVRDNKFVLGICYFIIVVTNIFNSN